VDEQQEVHAAGVDTGEDGGLAVATNGVHVATEHGLGQDEVVDEDQHTDDHQHDRGTTLISVTGGSQQVGDEGDDDRGKHNFEDGQAHRLGPTLATRARLRSWLQAKPTMHRMPSTMVRPSNGPHQPRMLGR